MLQWMGGSRRKVTTSRKSTQKRQKQYFEQRRRQQQHQHEAADGGNYLEENKTYCLQSGNSRSLDILSLLNLSAVAQEHRSSCPTAREKSEDDATNYQTFQHLPVVQSSEAKTQEHSKIEEARTSSSYQMGIAHHKMISVGGPGNHAEPLKTVGDKKNQLKMGPDCQLSVIDILGDNEPISSCEETLAHETHVAFSIEGLGKVETETPVHSPEAHGGSFLHGCSSPSKATKIANSSKDLTSEMVNLEFELDAMMRNIDLPFCRSSVEQPFFSKKRVDSFRNPKQKLAFKEFSPFTDSENSLHNLLGDDELFYGSKDRNDAIWNASGILADNSLDESDFHLFNKNWMDLMYTSDDFLNTMDCRKKHYTFEGLDQWEKRTTMRKAGSLETIESPPPNFKYQKLENVSKFKLPDIKWHSSIGRDHDFMDLKDDLGESSFITEDARESLSLPSEESCSSTAARGKLERTLLKDKQAIRDSDDICHAESVYSQKNTSPRGRNCNKWNRSTDIPQLHTTSKKRLKPDRSRYFEAEGGQSSGCNSLPETYGTTKHVTSGSGLWTEDPFHASGDTKLESSRSYFERSSKASAKCSPCCNFSSETHDFCQPNLQNMSGTSIQNIFHVSTLGQKSQKPFDVDGCLTPEKESIARYAEENSGVQVSDNGKFQPQKDEFGGSESSENGKSTDASDSGIMYRDCKEPTCETPNTGESEKETHCFKQAEDMLSLKNSNMFYGKQCNADRKCQLAQTSVLCQTGFGDIEVEDPRPKQRTIESDARGTADSTCQVMMFDSCVVQLLCVQVLKEVSAKVTGKQAYE